MILHVVHFPSRLLRDDDKPLESPGTSDYFRVLD